MSNFVKEALNYNSTEIENNPVVMNGNFGYKSRKKFSSVDNTSKYSKLFKKVKEVINSIHRNEEETTDSYKIRCYKEAIKTLQLDADEMQVLTSIIHNLESKTQNSETEREG